MEPKIKIEHLGKDFFSRRQTIKALDDVNMEFAPGEFVSIVGPSGCGKSTIIRMIDDLIKPTSGSITIDGFTYDNKKEIPQSFAKKLGFIFQLPNLYPWLTVRQNLYLPLKEYGMMDSEHVHHVEDLLEMANLTEVGNVYPNQISGGTAQRICL